MMIGHQIGYSVDPAGGVGHEYFGVLGPIAIMAAFVGLWWAGVSVVRRTGVPSTTIEPGFLARLVVLQSVLFAFIEVGERVVGSVPGPLWSMPVLLGLAAQPLVALIACLFLRVSGLVLVRLTSPGTDFVVAARRPRQFVPVRISARSAVVSPTRPRGPPLLVRS